LERFGFEVHPTTRSITYVSGPDESAIDYWMGTSALRIDGIDVGGSLVAQHRPVQAVIEVTTIDGSFRLLFDTARVRTLVYFLVR
jgi:hypothetical protein